MVFLVSLELALFGFCGLVGFLVVLFKKKRKRFRFRFERSSFGNGGKLTKFSIDAHATEGEG